MVLTAARAGHHGLGVERDHLEPDDDFLMKRVRAAGTVMGVLVLITVYLMTVQAGGCAERLSVAQRSLSRATICASLMMPNASPRS